MDDWGPVQRALDAFVTGVLICVGIVLAVFLVLWILFCLTLHRMQKQVRPRNRLISPGRVWLHLLHIGSIIPLVGPLFGLGGYIWDLIMVLKLSGSLEGEFRDRGVARSGAGYGKIVGLVWVGSGLASTLVTVAWTILTQAGVITPTGNDPLLNVLALGTVASMLVAVICWIIYWVQMAGYGRQLREGHRDYPLGSIEEDYDENFRRPRHDEQEYERRDEDEPRRRPREGDDERGDYDDRRDPPRRDDD
jgi:hypothetical protein